MVNSECFCRSTSKTLIIFYTYIFFLHLLSCFKFFTIRIRMTKCEWMDQVNGSIYYWKWNEQFFIERKCLCWLNTDVSEHFHYYLLSDSFRLFYSILLCYHRKKAKHFTMQDKNGLIFCQNCVECTIQYFCS